MNKKVFIPLIDSFVICDNNRKLYDFMKMWARTHEMRELDNRLGQILEFKRSKNDELEISKRLTNLFNDYIGELYQDSNGVIGFDISLTLESDDSLYMDNVDRE